MTELCCTLLTDGGFDHVLEHHLRWLLGRHLAPDIALNFDWADFSYRRPQPRRLRDRISESIRLYPCDILFVHRDAERETPSTRELEIAESIPENVTESLRHIPVIPVRMTEAWLLFDETAIRLAANNRRGRTPLPLPRLSRIEDIPDPKAILKSLLQEASGLSGQRLQRFDAEQAKRHIVSHIEDFSPLLEVQAFARLDETIRQSLQLKGWAVAPTNENR